jgi:hypothetical protein
MHELVLYDFLSQLYAERIARLGSERIDAQARSSAVGP